MPIKTKRFETAVELMEFLSPLNKQVWDSPYVFRGHGVASYVLTPVALRTNGPLSARGMMGAHNDNQVRQVDFEISLIDKFLRGCDASGIVVPGDNLEVRKEIAKFSVKKLYSDHAASWPPKSLWPLLATAQHHGVPTCLLDWSRRSYVAAYFAASTALTVIANVKLTP